jgi:DNA-binding transcriptional regulator YdaS (Cro superfamily)
MDLKTYFKKYNVKRKIFCEDVGIHYQHLNNILRGQRHPSAKLAKKIELATKGKVKAITLLYPR